MDSGFGVEKILFGVRAHWAPELVALLRGRAFADLGGFLAHLGELSLIHISEPTRPY